MKAPARPGFYHFTGTLASRAGRVQQIAIAGPRLKSGYLIEYSAKPNGRPRSNFTRSLK